MASGGARIALGTDTVGSVNAPAALDGAIGRKPTSSRVCRVRITPVSESLDTVGTLTRDVWDEGVVLTVIAGTEKRDDICLDDPVADHLAILEPTDWLAVAPRIGFVAALNDTVRVEADVATAVESAVDVLARADSVVEIVATDTLPAAVPIGLTLFHVEAAAAHTGLLKTLTATYGPRTKEILETGDRVSSVEYVGALRAHAELVDQVRDLFNAAAPDVIARPSLLCTAPPFGVLSSHLLSSQPASRSTVSSQLNDSLPVFLQFVGCLLSEPVLLGVTHGFMVVRQRPDRAARAR